MKTKKSVESTKHMTTEVTRDINMKARTLARARKITLSKFSAEVLTREVNRIWENQPQEDEGRIRTVVRDELARARGLSQQSR
jgi:hypothetical protein